MLNIKKAERLLNLLNTKICAKKTNHDYLQFIKIMTVNEMNYKLCACDGVYFVVVNVPKDFIDQLANNGTITMNEHFIGYGKDINLPIDNMYPDIVKTIPKELKPLSMDSKFRIYDSSRILNLINVINLVNDRKDSFFIPDLIDTRETFNNGIVLKVFKNMVCGIVGLRDQDLNCDISYDDVINFIN